MPQPFETFEPSAEMRSVYEGLLIALEPFGALRPQPVLADMRLKPGAPATAKSIMEVYGYLHSPLPPALEQFWGVADGLRFEVNTLVFSTAGFIAENRRIRNLPDRMPFEGLFFIGAMGDGDMFAMRRTSADQWNPSVMIWEHETDRRYEVAESLVEYVAKMIIRWNDESHA